MRRWIVAALAVVALAAPAHAAFHGSDGTVTPIIPPLTPIDVAAGGSWNGVAGSGGSPPSAPVNQLGAQEITGAASNGSGAIRLTVVSTTNFYTGGFYTVSGVAGTVEANNQWLVKVVDGTHLDLCQHDTASCTSTFTNAYSASSGKIGSVQTVIGNTSCYPHQVAEATIHCTIAGATSDRTQVDHVTCYLEGNNLTVSTQTDNPDDGSYGFVFPIASTAAQNGDALLYCDIYPVMGYVRRVGNNVGIPLWLDTSSGGAGWVDRSADYNATAHTGAKIYVSSPADSPAGLDPGSCANVGVPSTGPGTSGHPYASLRFGITCAPNGGVVVVKSGRTFVGDLSTCVGGSCNGQKTLTTNPSPRLIDIRPSVTPSTISAISYSAGTVSVTTSGSNTFANGNSVLITGVSSLVPPDSQLPGFDGVFTVTVADTTHFSYALGSDPGTVTSIVGAQAALPFNIVRTSRVAVATTGVSTSSTSPVTISQSNSFLAGTTVVLAAGGGTLPSAAPAGTYYVLASGLSGSSYQIATQVGGTAVTGGTAGSGFTVTSGPANSQILFPASYVNFTGAYFDLATISSFSLVNLNTTGGANDTTNHTNGNVIFTNSLLADSNGQSGGQYGYQGQGAGAPISNNPLLGSTGIFSGAVNAAIVWQASTTWQLVLNTTESISWDAQLLGAESANIRSFNRNVTQVQPVFHERYSTEPYLTVAARTFPGVTCGGANTDVTFSGSFTLLAPFHFVTATNSFADVYAGGPGGALTTLPMSGTPDMITTTTVCLTGDQTASVHASDVLSPYTLAHADCFQFANQQAAMTSPNWGNMYHQRYHCATSEQAVLVQKEQPPVAGPGTVTTVGTTATFSSAMTLQTNDSIYIDNAAHTLPNNYQSRRCVSITNSTHCVLAAPFYTDISSAATWYISKNAQDVACVGCVFNLHQTGTIAIAGQMQAFMQNFVLIQTTYTGTILALHNQTRGFGTEAFAILDSVFSDSGSIYSNALSVDLSSVVAGASIDNNQVYDGAYIGTSNGLQQNFTVDGTTQKPTSGLTKAMIGNPVTGKPLFPRNYDGTAIPNISSNPVIGAQQP